MKAATSIDAATLIRRNNRVVFRSLAGPSGAVLLHLDTSAYHGVNQVGELVWDLIGDGISFDELLRELQAQLDGAPPSLADEIASFLIDLQARDLLLLEARS